MYVSVCERESTVRVHVHACLLLPSSFLIKDLTFFFPSIDQPPPEHISGVNCRAAAEGSRGDELRGGDSVTSPRLRPASAYSPGQVNQGRRADASSFSGI